MILEYCLRVQKIALNWYMQTAIKNDAVFYWQVYNVLERASSYHRD